MPLLANELSVWDLCFRWAGLDPRKLWLWIPIDVQDHFRNLMDAILKAELLCDTITLEKRKFEEDEKMFSVYYWLDDIYDCIHSKRFNRKLLRWAHIGRYDFQLWCERRNIPLPEFWFPPGWNLEYELPEDEIHPGYWYYRRHWTSEQWEGWEQGKEVAVGEEDCENADAEIESKAFEPQEIASSLEKASDKMRPNQEARIACQQIARAIWRKEPDRTIASIVKDPLIQEYGGASFYVESTVREWIKEVASPHVSARRGRPPKNEGEEK